MHSHSSKQLPLIRPESVRPEASRWQPSLAHPSACVRWDSVSPSPPPVSTRLIRRLQGYKFVSAAAETLSLSFSSDPLISWLYRDPSGPRWDSLLPAVQEWQRFRVRSYILEGLTIEAVTDEPSPRSVGVCVLHPPRSQYLWLRPWWWVSYLQYYWDFVWNQPDEPLADKKVCRMLLEELSSKWHSESKPCMTNIMQLLTRSGAGIPPTQCSISRLPRSDLIPKEWG